jgi:fatty acid desaturase
MQTAGPPVEQHLETTAGPVAPIPAPPSRTGLRVTELLASGPRTSAARPLPTRPTVPPLADPAGPRRGSDYAELSQRVKAAGLLARRPGYYAVKIGLTGALLAAGWAAFVLVGESWWQLVTAVFLGIAFTQAAFLGHDAGHKQIVRTRRASYVLGLLHGNLAVGLSYGWWVDKHNRHHAHPNEIGGDPDIGPGALVFVPGQDRRHRLTRLLTRAQAYLFFPMLLLEGVNLHVAGLLALRERHGKARWVEGALLLAHAAGYLAIVLVVLSPLQALAFVAVQQGVFGFSMGCAFAPNHKGMPILSRGEEPDFLRRQVLTSRNVRGGRFVDLVLGGLNYQIEHHLFPSMPRPNLRRAQALVREFCQEHHIPYSETSLLASYGLALRHLHAVGRSLPE